MPRLAAVAPDCNAGGSSPMSSAMVQEPSLARSKTSTVSRSAAAASNSTTSEDRRFAIFLSAWMMVETRSSPCSDSSTHSFISRALCGLGAFSPSWPVSTLPITSRFDRTKASGLLISCVIDAASWPISAIFSRCTATALARVMSASSALRSETSRKTARIGPPSSPLTRCSETSTGTSLLPGCCTLTCAIGGVEALAPARTFSAKASRSPGASRSAICVPTSSATVRPRIGCTRPPAREMTPPVLSTTASGRLSINDCRARCSRRSRSSCRARSISAPSVSARPCTNRSSPSPSMPTGAQTKIAPSVSLPLRTGSARPEQRSPLWSVRSRGNGARESWLRCTGAPSCTARPTEEVSAPTWCGSSIDWCSAGTATWVSAESICVARSSSKRMT